MEELDENELIDASYAPEPDPEEGIIDLNEGRPPVPGEEAIKRRSKLAHVALGEKSPGEQSLFQEIAAGNEDSLRQQTVQNRELEFSERKLKAIAKLSESGMGPLTPQEQTEIMSLREEQFRTNPDVIWETEYGKRIIEAQIQLGKMGTGDTPEAEAERKPVATIASQAIAKHELTQKIAEYASQKWQEQSFLGKAGDIAIGMVPFYEWIKKQNALGKGVDSPFLSGSNIEEQMRNLHAMEPSEMYATLKGAVDKLIEDGDVKLANDLAQAAVSYTKVGKAIDNLFSIVDLTAVGEVASIGIKAARGIRSTKAMTKELDAREARAIAQGTATPEQAAKVAGDVTNAAADITKAAVRHNADPQKVAAAAGDLDTAAQELAEKLVRQNFETKATPQQRMVAEETTPSLFSPRQVIAKESTLEAPAAQRIFDHMIRNSQRLLGALVDVSNIERLSDDVVKVAIRKAKEEVHRELAHTQNAILNVTATTTSEGNLANVYKVGIELGDRNGNLFESAQDAWKTASRQYGLHEGDYKLQRVGFDRWKLKLERVIDETDPDVREAMAIGTDKTPAGLINTYLGKFRSPEDTLSPHQRKQRHTLVHAQNRLHEAMKESAEALGTLNRKERKGLQKVLEQNRDFLDPKTGDRGMYHKDVYSLEKAYRKINGRLPTEKEIKAYYEYVQLNDFDWMVKNLSLYRFKARQGIMEYTYPFQMMTPDGFDTKNMRVEGKRITQLPDTARQDANIWIHTEQGAEPIVISLHKMTPDQKKMIDQLVQEKGFQILQLANPLDNPLKHFLAGNKTINFTIMPEGKRRNLTFKQLNYKPGGHVGVKSEWLVKQPRIVQTQELAPQEELVTVYRAQPKAGSTQAPVADWLKESSEYKSMQQASGRWWTDDPEEVKWYLDNEYPDGEVVSMKVPKSIAEEYRVSKYALKTQEGISPKAISENPQAFSRRAEKELYLPKDVIEKAKRGEYDKPATVTRSMYDYEGDVSLLGFRTEAEAIKYSKHMDEARKLYLAGDTQALRTYIDRNLAHSYTDFVRLFEPRRGMRPNGTQYDMPPLLDKTVPIRHTYTGSNILDVHKDFETMYPSLRNNIRSEYNLYQTLDKKFTGERNEDLMTIKEGTEERPLLRMESADKLDPYEMLDTAMSSTIRSHLSSDYKIQATEYWMAEFGHLLDVPKELLMSDPIYYLHTAKLSSKTPMSADMKAAAENARIAIKNLLGTESEMQEASSMLQQRLMSAIYETNFRAGPVRLGGQRQSDWISDKLLPITTDPLGYMRSFAFHTKLGMFNPVQIWLQAQTMALTASISPQHALGSLSMSTLQRMALYNQNPQILNKMADLAEGMGMSRLNFIESLEGLKKTGFHLVEGETAWKDALDWSVYKSTMGKILDKSTMFFKGTERMVRMNAWNTAYLEWKAANPGRRFGNRARQETLIRAQDLSVNMTRASNAQWQQGILSVPTQFWGYQVRLMELLAGKRLTTAEKARVILGQSLLYGVPVGMTATNFGPVSAVGAGLTTALSGGGVGETLGAAAAGLTGGFYPWAEDLRKSALERGVDVDSPGWTVFLEGLPKLLLQSITGSDSNVSERYGPSGLKIIKEMTGDGDKTMVEIIFGASGQITYDAFKSLYPVFRYMLGAFEDGNEEIPLTAEDFLNLASNISTVNNTTKMIQALNIGKYITKNQIEMTDMTTMDAILTGVMGLSPQEVPDAMLMMQSLKSRSDAKKEAEKGMVANFRKALEAAGNQDRAMADMYLRRAKLDGIAGGLDPLDHHAVFSKAVKRSTSLIDQIRQDFFLDKAPGDKRELMRERFIQDQQRKSEQ